MRATELRIGNFTYNKKLENIFKDGVKTITGRDIYNLISCELGVTVEDKYQHFKPIPLTEEWLIKLGFDSPQLAPVGTATPRNPVYTCDIINFEIKKMIGVGAKGFMIIIRGAFSLPHIKYVHQLQNLYFALTNEELK